MNVAKDTTRLDSYSVLTRASPQSLEPIPKTDDLGDLDDDIQLFRVLDLTDDLPTPAPLPEKRPPILNVDRMVVSATLIRRIEYELRHDQYDSRTVFSSCRGLTRGSPEFEDAYTAARIRSFVKHQRIPTDPPPDSQTNMETQPRTPRRTAMNQKPPPPPHPMAVMHLGHLMSHLGIWVIALLGIQAWAAWRLSAVANVYLEGGRFFYFAIGIFLMLALDSVIWFRRRGYLIDAFLIPGAVLFLMALLPIIALHVREVLLAMN